MFFFRYIHRGFFLLLLLLPFEFSNSRYKKDTVLSRNTVVRRCVFDLVSLFSRPPSFVVVVVFRFGWCLVEILLVFPIRARMNWSIWI